MEKLVQERCNQTSEQQICGESNPQDQPFPKTWHFWCSKTLSENVKQLPKRSPRLGRQFFSKVGIGWNRMDWICLIFKTREVVSGQWLQDQEAFQDVLVSKFAIFHWAKVALGRSLLLRESAILCRSSGSFQGETNHSRVVSFYCRSQSTWSWAGSDLHLV